MSQQPGRHLSRWTLRTRVTGCSGQLGDTRPILGRSTEENERRVSEYLSRSTKHLTCNQLSEYQDRKPYMFGDVGTVGLSGRWGAPAAGTREHGVCPRRVEAPAGVEDGKRWAASRFCRRSPRRWPASPWASGSVTSTGHGHTTGERASSSRVSLPRASWRYLNLYTNVTI